MSAEKQLSLPGTKTTGTLNLRDLPLDLRSQFKSRCAARNRTMTGLLVAFMRDVCKDEPNNKVVNVGRLSRQYRLPR